MTKSIRNIALTLALASAGHPAWSDQAMIIGTQTDAFCTNWLNTRANPKPANKDNWLAQCRIAVNKQDQCVRNAGYPTKPANEQTTACWNTLQAELRAIPTN